MAMPDGTLTVQDKRAAIDVMLKAGADIRQLNTVRKHLSAVKGGRLAAAAATETVALAISDVVGDDLSVIGSGPTVPDPSTFADAWACLERLKVIERVPPAVTQHLLDGRGGRHAETPKPGDPRLARASSKVIGGRGDALRGARTAAEVLGYSVAVIDEPTLGEARRAAPQLLARARTIAGHEPRPCCVLAAGETTVHVTGSGKGGRNQEMALALVRALADDPRMPLAFGSIGTDGIDGPTDAAGAYCDGTSLGRARSRGLDPARYLRDNNAYAFFRALGDLIMTGPTTTNVGDIQVVLFP
jgi:hydroxypyruvate reductase